MTSLGKRIEAQGIKKSAFRDSNLPLKYQDLINNRRLLNYLRLPISHRRTNQTRWHTHLQRNKNIIKYLCYYYILCEPSS